MRGVRTMQLVTLPVNMHISRQLPRCLIAEQVVCLYRNGLTNRRSSETYIFPTLVRRLLRTEDCILMLLYCSMQTSVREATPSFQSM